MMDKKNSPGFIYLKDDGRDYKLGRTNNPKHRHGEYLTENPRLKTVDIWETTNYQRACELEASLIAATSEWRTHGKEWRKRCSEFRDAYSVFKIRNANPVLLTKFDLKVAKKLEDGTYDRKARERKDGIAKLQKEFEEEKERLLHEKCLYQFRRSMQMTLEANKHDDYCRGKYEWILDSVEKHGINCPVYKFFKSKAKHYWVSGVEPGYIKWRCWKKCHEEATRLYRESDAYKAFCNR